MSRKVRVRTLMHLSKTSAESGKHSVERGSLVAFSCMFSERYCYTVVYFYCFMHCIITKCEKK